MNFDGNLVDVVFHGTHAGENLPAFARRLRGILEQVHQNTFYQIVIRQRDGCVRCHLDRITHFRMRRLEKRDAFFDQRMQIELLRTDWRLG